MAEGTIFIRSDFADIADTETTRRNLNRLTQASRLRRILKGVYEKPTYSKLLNEYVAANPEAVDFSLIMALQFLFCGIPYSQLTVEDLLEDPMF